MSARSRNIATHFEARRGVKGQRLFFVLLLVSFLISLLAVVQFDRSSARQSLLDLTNLVGPTTASLLQGHGMTACTVLLGTPGDPICFHGGRMPVPTLVVAGGIRLLGDRFVPVAVLKTLLLLLPLEGAIYVTCMGAQLRRREWVIGLFLLTPFGITAFLANVVNLQVEEGYTYSFMALLTALVLFRNGRETWLRSNGLGEAVVFGIAVCGLYLSKSSMAPAAAVLTMAYLLRVRRTEARVIAAALALAAPFGWAVHQHHATGRFSLGTSIDGLNLRKGNDPGFLDRYPPAPGETLDGYDTVLNEGRHFNDEWSFDDFHRYAAIAYIGEHPELTARGDVRKLEMIFVSVRKYGSGASHGAMLAIELLGMAVFRLLFWAAIVASAAGLVSRWRDLRWEGAFFLLLLGAVALPYVIGFAYTRHVSVLIYPSVLMCCRALGGAELPGAGDGS